MLFRQQLTVAQIAKITASEVIDADTVEDTINGIAPLDEAGPEQLSFLYNANYLKNLSASKAQVIVTNAEFAQKLKDCGKCVLVAKEPRMAIAKLLEWLNNAQFAAKPHIIHPSAIIGTNVELGLNVHIGANAVVGDNVSIGNNVSIASAVVILDNVVLEDNVTLLPHVTIYQDVYIANGTKIHANSVIGSDGFGFVQDKGKWLKMPHLGGVKIGKFVEIGSNTSVDRGLVGDTHIGDYVIIDNLVQIAHNVNIGANTAIAGCCAIAGSVKIGENCMLGGASSIAGHISIADNTIITGASAVTRSIEQAGTAYSSGFPARPSNKWWRIVARIINIEQLFNKVKTLEVKIEELKNEES